MNCQFFPSVPQRGQNSVTVMVCIAACNLWLWALLLRRIAQAPALCRRDVQAATLAPQPLPGPSRVRGTRSRLRPGNWRSLAGQTVRNWDLG